MLARNKTKSGRSSGSNLLNDSKGRIKGRPNPEIHNSKLGFGNTTNSLSKDNTGECYSMQDSNLEPKHNGPSTQHQRSDSKNSQLAIIEQNLNNMATSAPPNYFLTLNINVSNASQQNQQNSVSTNVMEQPKSESQNLNNKDEISLNELGLGSALLQSNSNQDLDCKGLGPQSGQTSMRNTGNSNHQMRFTYP